MSVEEATRFNEVKALVIRDPTKRWILTGCVWC
jgi:hypothetical protein